MQSLGVMFAAVLSCLPQKTLVALIVCLSCLVGEANAAAGARQFSRTTTITRSRGQFVQAPVLQQSFRQRSFSTSYGYGVQSQFMAAPVYQVQQAAFIQQAPVYVQQAPVLLQQAPVYVQQAPLLLQQAPVYQQAPCQQAAPLLQQAPVGGCYQNQGIQQQLRQRGMY